MIRSKEEYSRAYAEYVGNMEEWGLDPLPAALNVAILEERLKWIRNLSIFKQMGQI